jgi:hypothetical protein
MFGINLDKEVWFRSMVLNAPFNNISVISWRSVLVVEEIRVHGENHQPAVRHCQTWIRRHSTKLTYILSYGDIVNSMDGWIDG